MTSFFVRGQNGHKYWDHAGSSTQDHRPWSPEEVATLARGFIDLDLEEDELHAWCVNQGINRTRGAVDYKLLSLNFFTPRVDPSKAVRDRKHHAARALAAAKQCLANQIKLAKLEVAAGCAPPYKPHILEW